MLPVCDFQDGLGAGREGGREEERERERKKTILGNVWLSRRDDSQYYHCMSKHKAAC